MKDINKADNALVLLLTGTINVYDKHFTLLTDASKRRQQYVDTLKYYLSNYKISIVFVENSGEDLSSFFRDEIKRNEIEILYFEGNNYPAELGKGLGEMKCIQYAIENSAFINEQSFVFKITGRYKIVNLESFLRFYKEKSKIDLHADLTNNFQWSASAIFGFRPFFAKEYLFKNIDLINDSLNFSFEHALAKAVLEAIGNHVNFEIFKHYPVIKAISGTTAKSYNTSFLYHLPRKVKYFTRYYVAIR